MNLPICTPSDKFEFFHIHIWFNGDPKSSGINQFVEVELRTFNVTPGKSYGSLPPGRLRLLGFSSFYRQIKKLQQNLAPAPGMRCQIPADIWIEAQQLVLHIVWIEPHMQYLTMAEDKGDKQKQLNMTTAPLT
ncbi:hypothetical protein ACFX13_014093 [Malus domestica]